MRALTAAVILGWVFCPASVHGQAAVPPGDEVTLKGSMVCNGACVPGPKAEDHVMVVFAIDGTPGVRAEVEKIMTECYPEKGLDAESAVKVMDAFSERLKYFITPGSPALADGRKGGHHYCMPAQASAVTGSISERDGKKWILATKIEPTALKYPDRMLAPDRPFVMPRGEPVVLKVTDTLTLKCVPIPAGKFLMGTPVYTWPYFQEEFPHLVTLTKPFHMSEVPVTQEIYEAVMGENPSTYKHPRVPVQDPKFADVDRFCRLLSEKTGRTVRLPTDAEWEWAARVGTSNPGFHDKYTDQNSGGDKGFREVLPVKSRKPNPWGLYDMVSCWWEITADRGMYNVRRPEVDPYYPPRKPETERSQRNGRGLLKPHYTIVTHEFITEKGYAGQKFRVVVESAEKKVPE